MVKAIRAWTLATAFVVSVGCSRRHSGPSVPVAYVSDEEGGLVVAVDPVRAEVIVRIPVGKRPRGLKVAPDGTRLFVALSGSPRAGPGVEAKDLPPPDRAADGIGVVDLASNKVIATFPSGQDPESFDISPDGKTLYVSNEESAELTAVDVGAGTVRAKVGVGHEPEGVKVRPDGKVVLVTSEQDDEVTAIDAATLAVLAHVPTGARPRGIAFTPDGLTAFITNEGSASVTVVDTAAFRPVASIPVSQGSATPGGPRPMGAAVSADGKMLYVSTGRGGSIAVIDVPARKQEVGRASC